MAAPVIQFKRGLLANLPGLRAGEPGFTTDSYDLYVGIDSTTTNNKFFGSHRYWTKGTASTGSGVNFVEGTTNGTQYVTLKAPDSLSGITTFTLPATDGSNGYILTTNGSGTLSFSAPAASSFTIAADSGSSDTFNTGETLTFAGTAKEINTTVTNNQIQIGLPDDVEIANNFKVAGVSTFVGAVTFQGGTITLGDATTDNVVFTADVNSDITPNTDATYNFGNGSQRWNNASFAGIVTATTFSGSLSGNASSADQVKTVTAANNNATYHITFVDANNGSATNETVYTDDGIYYNPGTNTFTTQHALFTGNVEVQGTLTGTATTATRATTVDTTSTSTNASYFVPFVDTLAGQNGETIRVGAGLSVNPSTGNVGVSSILSVGNINDVNAYIKAGGGSNALYLYSNGDVSFQAKAIVNEIRSASSATTLITLSGLDATFAQNVKVTGITTTGTLKLNGTPGIGITGVSSSTTLAENSNDYLPTQAAVKAYVDAVDVTTGIAGDTGTGTVSTSQTLTVAGTAGEIETSASGQTITVGLPDTVIVGTALSAPTVKTATIQHRNGTQAATIDTSGNITASQNLTVSGNLYVNGSTTQVNTASMTVEDRTIELGQVDGSAPSSTTTWDLGVLFNYYDGSAKKSALVWEQSAARFKLASVVSDGGGTDNDSPQITFTTYAALEIGGLWVNDCAGQSQVINCSGSTRTLENITIDGGSFT
jgi:hypothetical protein